MRFSGSVFINRVDDGSNELSATLVVEPTTVLPTPSREVLRCDIDLLNDHPLAFEKLNEALSNFKPLLETAR